MAPTAPRRVRRIATAALALALLVGCSNSSTADSAASGGGAGEEASLPQPTGSEDLGGAPGEAVDPDDRQVVTTATASLAVEDPAEAAQSVSELVESVGGRVDERTEQAVSGENGSEGTVADLVLRVPADELTGVLADLADLGDVEHVSVSRSDVTATAVDLDARIRALRTSAARLEELLEGAANTQALLAAEEILAERQQELESLQSRRALLADQVELSTLSVHLQPFGVAPPGGPNSFADGLGTGWRSLVSALGAVVVVLGVVLPWLAVVALVTVAVLVPVRLARRRPPVEAAAPPEG
ncbi:DUF4349 domain-containing protein [Blastococcus sp. PRF04-17]|uniref:DUF4349 domain-containing protein n=1 Tax=Blastococcus sp. PRF04-17 TaxID=2933797 RepID=UPI001FF4B25E|nr:DUF4349 domain-containing protein [Blastococcus sp. PRF04-17]UOY01828.1 DUF4349 domain-containing protein [Blastococcus sp. PRF04-17]